MKSRYVLFQKNFKDVDDKIFREYQKLENKMERKNRSGYSFFTVDWRGGKIVQCQGKGRIRYPQEMVEFVHYAEEKLRLLKGEEEKKAA